MSAQRYVVMVGVLGLAAVGLLLPSERAYAQLTAGEAMAGTAGMDTLNGGGGGMSASSGVGALGLGRARNAAAAANGNNAMQMQGLNATGGAPMPGANPVAVPGTATAAPGTVGASGLTPDQQARLSARGPMITVINGVRVFDAITGELIDDAVKKKVPEKDKDKYFDDGPTGGHGDMVAGDEIYTNVDDKASKKDVLSAANEKVKEQLVQALRVAANYTPLEFYGYRLMSTDHQQPLPRQEAWTIEKDPNGQGQMLVEKPVDRPLEVPKYREKLKEKDQKVKDDWALRFLNEYRKKKDDLSSEFYQVYIPMPPLPPGTMPPTGWRPFADPTAEIKAQRASQNPLLMQQMYGQMGQNPMMGNPMGMMGGMQGGGMMGGRGYGGGNRGFGGGRR